MDGPESPSAHHFHLFLFPTWWLNQGSGPTMKGCGWYPWIVAAAQGQGVHITYALSHIYWHIKNVHNMEMECMVLTYPQLTISTFFVCSYLDKSGPTLEVCVCAVSVCFGSPMSPNIYCYLHVGPMPSMLQYGEDVGDSESLSAHHFHFHLFLFPQFWLNLVIPWKDVDGVGI